MSGIQTVKPCSRTPLRKKAEILATKIQRKLRKTTVARSDKTGARIQKTLQNPKHIPESKTTGTCFGFIMTQSLSQFNAPLIYNGVTLFATRDCYHIYISPMHTSRIYLRKRKPKEKQYYYRWARSSVPPLSLPLLEGSVLTMDVVHPKLVYKN